MNGIQFRVSVLIAGLAVTLMLGQLLSDTLLETRKAQDARLAEARTMTNVVARSLEKQFDFFDLSEIEGILGSVRQAKNVKQVLAVDPGHTFFLDGDPQTPEILAFENVPEQSQALETSKATYSVEGDTITVAEPLLRGGGVIGSVMIRYENPGFGEIMLPIVRSNLFSTIPILILGLLVGGILVRQITTPLLRLSNAAKEVAEGNLEAQIPVSGPNEISNLGFAFSGMIEKLKQNIGQIYELAYVDRTTQLPNREFFRKELSRAIRRVARQRTTGALLFVDLDGFKKVNDMHGHDVGDILLQQFSERLATVLRAEDLVGFKTVHDADSDLEEETNAQKNKQMLARLGGDEFTVLLSELREATDAATVAQRIIDAVSDPFTVGETTVTIGASVGIAIFPQDGSDYQTILKSADMAMYQAKDEGKNTYRYFSEELNVEASRRIVIENDLRIALEDEEKEQLQLFYQPKVDCKTGRPKSVEALVRWNHPEKGMIPPLDFINVAEDCGLILPLGKWVLEEACRQIIRFTENGMNISVAVNISTAQFDRPDLSKIVIDAVEMSGADPTKLELELTESMAMQNPERALEHINALKAIGIRFAIDDFGTGYSNLSQLSQLPFDVFKIDRSFIQMLTNRDDAHGRVIVRTILAMANSLNYETIAEGVETVAQLEFLSEYGCDYAQGFYFARPMPESEFNIWYAAWLAKDANSLANVMRQGAAA